MANKSLLDLIRDFQEKNPDLKKIMAQLSIDEQSYFDSLRQMLGAQPVFMQPLSNTTCLQSDNE
ncbi:MAG: hypothetical protein FJZ11_03320 [Candidatus Omnitrophica bacterium]|nr:hypothetical protein [Candidatus Omnitrophota bacterium]